jgi:hypothetical protein
MRSDDNMNGASRSQSIYGFQNAAGIGRIQLTWRTPRSQAGPRSGHLIVRNHVTTLIRENTSTNVAQAASTQHARRALGELPKGIIPAFPGKCWNRRNTNSTTSHF